MNETAYRDAVLQHGVPIHFESSRDIDGVLDALCSSMRSDMLRYAVSHGRFWSGSDRVIMLPDTKMASNFVKELDRLSETDSEHADLARELVDEADEAIRQHRQISAGGSCGIDKYEAMKVTPEALERAREEVGTPKKRANRPRPKDPLIVSYGLGVDSTAVLVGLHQLVKEGHEEFRPDYILFADVGSEADETYAYLKTINAWLESVGFPYVQVVGWATEFMAKSYGSSRTLEQQCINNQTMPSISASKFDKSVCSVLWKQATMNCWTMAESGYFKEVHGGRGLCHNGLQLPRGMKIVKAIGYDADETNRERAGTFRVKEEMQKEKELKRASNYEYWYPLMMWGWDRARCIAEIEAEIGKSPQKSSCTMCGAMRRVEIRALPKDDLTRALLIEQVAIHGRHKSKQSHGLGGSYRWSDFAINEGLLTERELSKIIETAKEIIRVAPKKPGVRDNSQHPFIASLPAFSDMKGFRGKRLPLAMWDRSEAMIEDVDGDE